MKIDVNNKEFDGNMRNESVDVVYDVNEIKKIDKNEILEVDKNEILEGLEKAHLYFPKMKYKCTEDTCKGHEYIWTVWEHYIDDKENEKVEKNGMAGFDDFTKDREVDWIIVRCDKCGKEIVVDGKGNEIEIDLKKISKKNKSTKKKKIKSDEK